ncbi:MAG: hypothetical protein PHX13_10560 [Thiovulaceae bacterium]|nr:hypothetical protein [Sulfurimonadaceae bacterium]
MLRLIVLFLVSFSLHAQSINLLDFAFIVQKKDNVSIIFANDVPKNLMINFPDDYSKASYLPFFKSVLSANNLSFKNDDGIVTVSNIKDSPASIIPNSTKIDSNVFLPIPQNSEHKQFDNNFSMNKAEDYNFSFIPQKLNYLQFDDIKPLLEFSKIPYSFSAVSKTIIFKDNGKNSKLIKKLCDQIDELDVLKKQVTLKVTVFDTNQNKLKDVGINPNLSFDFDILSKTGALLTGSHVADFKGSLKFLQTSGVTKIIQSTSYLISDSENLEFNKVLSIPVLDENYVVTSQSSVNQSTRHKYIDVGFIVKTTPTIVGDTVYLDFSLSIGNIVTSGDLPVTSKTSVNNKFSIKKGQVLLLAGISKGTLIKSNNGLPFLERFPFLSSIFTEKSDSNTDETFNVSIEVF